MGNDTYISPSSFDIIYIYMHMYIYTMHIYTNSGPIALSSNFAILDIFIKVQKHDFMKSGFAYFYLDLYYVMPALI